MIAGYYSYSVQLDKIKKRLIKILKILFYGLSVYLLYFLLRNIKNGSLISLMLNLMSLKNIIKAVVFCTIDFAIPLWYLLAMAETYVLWYVIVKYHKEELALKCIPLLIIFRLLLTIFCETTGTAWFLKVNFVSCGFVWFVLGYYFHTIDINRYNKWKLLVFMCGGYIISTIKILTGIRIDISSIGIMMYSIAIFLIALQNSNKHVCNMLEYVGDKLSLNVYILHVPIGGIIMAIARQLNLSSNIYLWIHPVLSIALTLLISYLINRTLQIFSGSINPNTPKSSR